MSSYDFKSLSSYDFEVLTRDLLQRHWNIQLESFKSGRDGGIDLRYAKPKKESVIIQCKHYSGSNVSILRAKLKSEEYSKIQKISPSRYLLVTSLPLSPKDKDDLIKDLHPFIQGPGDIVGMEDLNNLLGMYPEIEKQHYKLWLTSSAVLEKIIHSNLYTSQKMELDILQKKMKLYVQNSVFHEVLNILDANSHCVISGIPGIGKTTLAEIVLIHYITKGYQVIKITGDLTEGLKLFNPLIPQIFYYDDFLGKTYLGDHFQKNEDTELVKFFKYLQDIGSHKFILTTREHILNQAMSRSETLTRFNQGIRKCVVDLKDYTSKDKAQILYNHLYFSSLETEYLFRVRENNNYRRIIEHKNFSPRIIEWMTELAKNFNIKPENYINEFLNTLNNPFVLWKFAFENQLSNAGRSLLLVLATLPAHVHLDDATAAFNLYYPRQANKFRWITNPLDFRNALKEINGTFITISSIMSVDYIQFHSPSVNDFLENYLFENRVELYSIVDSLFLPQQLERLEGILFKNHLKKTSVLSFSKLPPHDFIELAKQKSTNRPAYHEFISFEKNMLFLLQSGFKYGIGIEDLVKRVFRELTSRMEKESGDKRNLLNIIDLMSAKYPTLVRGDSAFIVSMYDYCTRVLDHYEDFEIFNEIRNRYPEKFTTETVQVAADQFVKCIDSDIASWISDNNNPEDLRNVGEELFNLGEEFGLDLSDDLERFNDAAAKIERDEYLEADDDVYYGGSGGSATPFVNEYEEIDNLFDNLGK